MNKAAERERGGGQGGLFIMESGFRCCDGFPTGLKVCRDSEERRRTSGPRRWSDLSSDVHNAPHSSSLCWRCCPTLGHPACDLTARGRARCTDALFIAELHSKHLYAFTGTVLPAGMGGKKEEKRGEFNSIWTFLSAFFLCGRISSQVVTYSFFFSFFSWIHGAISLLDLCAFIFLMKCLMYKSPSWTETTDDEEEEKQRLKTVLREARKQRLVFREINLFEKL